MASRVRLPRVTLANLKPAPGSQHNVSCIPLNFTLYSQSPNSKNELAVVKVLDMAGQLDVVPKVKSRALVLGPKSALRVVKHQLPSCSPSEALST
jgi:hypothetical protein